MMYRIRSITQPHARGFTLMEVMIAMTLIGLALTIAFAALSFASRSWERTDVQGAELEQLRTAFSVVRRQLSQALAIRPDESKRDLLFHGSSQSLEFVAPAPMQDGRLAALYRFRLRFSSDKQGKALQLDYCPYLPGKEQGWQDKVDSSLLVSGLVGGRFTYFTPTDSQHGNDWHASWDKTEQLPRMVRLELQLSEKSAPWPPLVVLLPINESAR